MRTFSENLNRVSLLVNQPARGRVSSVMYQHERNQRRVRWWLTTGFCALFLTVLFICVTLWFGFDLQRRTALQEFTSPQSVDFYDNKIFSSNYAKPPLDYQTFNFRTNKGRVEMVNKDGEVKNKTNSNKADDVNAYGKFSSSGNNSEEITLAKPEREVEEEEYARKLEDSEGNIDPVINTEPKGSNIKKKSEAVFPSEEDPENIKPPVFQGGDYSKNENQFQDIYGVSEPYTPPVNYFSEPSYRIPVLEDRKDEFMSDEEIYTYGKESINRYDGEPSETAENPVYLFLQKKMEDLHEWMSDNENSSNADWSDMLAAMNQSLHDRNSSVLLSKLKEIYYTSADAEDASPGLLYPTFLQNGTGLISFGLLAVDLFLLHNVQKIAWNEENGVGEEMMKDPEVVALNALFMSPERVKQMAQRTSGNLTAEEVSKSRGLISEAMDFVNGMLRAILNLTRAYGRSRSDSSERRSDDGAKTFDCIWTLYCRNLDKTAKLRGPYGFLAKMNR